MFEGFVSWSDPSHTGCGRVGRKEGVSSTRYRFVLVTSARTINGAESAKEKLICPFHLLAYNIDCHERAGQAKQLLHPILKRGHLKFHVRHFDRV